jgi:hypothetical protein
MTSACPHHDDVGAWVLHALADDDANRFEQHLAGCEHCQADVAELQGVADVLPMAADQLEPPPELKGRIMAIVNAEAQLLAATSPEADQVPEPVRRPPERVRERRRWLGPLVRLRPIPAAALASLILAVGVAGGILLSGGSSTDTHHGFGPRGAEVALRVSNEHGRLDVTGMPAPPPGRVYQVWLIKGKQKPIPTQTLFTPRGGRASVNIMESLKGTDKVLVTAEPPGGSEQPTSKPVAGATLT